MATTAERLSVVEVKVQVIEEKIDDVKGDVKEMHDCLDRTRDLLDAKLDSMLDEYKINRDKFYAHADKLHELQCAQHAELAGKIGDLEKFKNKGTMYIMVLLAFGAGTGWLGHLDFAKLLKFVGL